MCNTNHIMKASLATVTEPGRPIRPASIVCDIFDNPDAHSDVAVILTASCVDKAKIAQMHTRFGKARPAHHAVL